MGQTILHFINSVQTQVEPKPKVDILRPSQTKHVYVQTVKIFERIKENIRAFIMRSKDPMIVPSCVEKCLLKEFFTYKRLCVQSFVRSNEAMSRLRASILVSRLQNFERITPAVDFISVWT